MQDGETTNGETLSEQTNTTNGVAGVKVILYNASTNQSIGYTTTDAMGDYVFTDLTPGNYYVQFDLSTLPGGYMPTGTNTDGGPNNTGESDAYGFDGKTPFVSITAGQQNYSLDMGIIINPLPVELTLFEGYGKDCKVELRWVTESEKYNKGFVVEKSIDGINYYPIGEKAGNINSTAKLEYTLSDDKVALSGYYYRLKQIDLDGTETIFDNIYVSTNCTKYTQVGITALYPNPLKDGMVLTMKYYSETSGTARYQIITMDGKVLNTNTTGMVEGTNTVQIEVNGLPAGAYLVKLIGNEKQVSVKKFIKTE